MALQRGPRRHWLKNVPLPEPYLFGVATAVVIQRMWPRPLPGPRYARRLVGWPLIAAGSYLVVGAVAAVGPTDIERPDRLVVSGPYTISRNPMYVGWALVHLGIGAAGGSAWLVAAFPAAAGLIHREILREEVGLSATFGDEFQRYRAMVPRYLRVPWRRAVPSSIVGPAQRLPFIVMQRNGGVDR